VIAGTGQLCPDRVQALWQRIYPLARWKGQDGEQRWLCRVELAYAQPCHGQVDVRQHAQLEAVVLAALRSGSDGGR
jgi:hypothetical protein